MKLKSKCCGKYQRKAKACAKCPVMAVLSRKQRKRCLAKAKKRLAKSA